MKARAPVPGRPFLRALRVLGLGTALYVTVFLLIPEGIVWLVCEVLP